MITYIAFVAMLLIVLMVRARITFSTGLIFFILLVFVGLRHETGYDWPVYKQQFEYFASVPFGSFINEPSLVFAAYNHEVGFVLFQYILSQILPSFELAQLVYLFILLGGICFLARAFEENDIALTLVLVTLFTMFTLEMSTLRQALAIACLNFGLGFFFRGKRFVAYLLIPLGLLFHISTVIYILALFGAKFVRGKGSILTLSAGAFALGLSMPLIIGFASNNLGLISLKFAYYLDKQYSSNLAEQIFMLVLFGGIIFSSFTGLESLRDQRDNPDARNRMTLFRISIILSVLALLFFDINTIRNRIFYENIILFSVLFAGHMGRLTKLYRLMAVMAGLLFFGAQLIKPQSIAYTPYQNYLIDLVFSFESSGQARQDELFYQVRNR